MDLDAGFWAGRRVLVTGSTGFKGAWLTLWLHRLGADVSGLADGVPTEPSLWDLARVGELCIQHTADVRDAAAVEAAVEAARPDVLFHLAAQPFVRRSFAEPVETYATNVLGTAHVLEAARRAGVGTIVSVTSDKCYENREWEWGYREDDALGGRDPYASSKAGQEIVSHAWRASYGLRVATARAGNVIGGGDWGEGRLLPDILRSAFARRPVEIRRPDAVRPWQHVLNPLNGYLLLAEALAASDAHATAFNFGPPAEDVRPVGWIVERMAERLPTGLAHRLDPGPHPHEAQALALDSSRARTRLGWRPRWGLDAALDAVVDWHVAVDGGADARAVTAAQIDAYAEAGRSGGE